MVTSPARYTHTMYTHAHPKSLITPSLEQSDLALLDTSASVAAPRAASNAVWAAHVCGPRRKPTRGPDFELVRCVENGCDKYVATEAHATNASLARAALAEGYSLTIRHVELRHAGIAGITAAVGEALEAPAQANVYVTPPKCVCARAHCDRHDVYAWQLHGAKARSVREVPVGATPPPPPPRERPPPGAPRLLEAKAFATERVITLTPGDALYVPRGAPHCCESAGDVASVHVSFGVDVHRPLTWEGALHAALRRRHASPAAHAALLRVAEDALPELRRACVPCRDRREGAAILRAHAAAARSLGHPSQGLRSDARCVAAPAPVLGGKSAGDRVRIHQCIDQKNPQLSSTRTASAQFPIYSELQQNHDVRGDICHA